MAAILTIYFSHTGENYFGGRIRPIAKGNTAYVAEYIQQAVGGDLFEIQTTQPYPENYSACTKQAKEEQQANARPQLKEYLPDLAGYDTIFVGYPNWWGSCPMAVFTFLEHYDLTGKRILPFCTNEGSGMGSSESDLKRICAGATVEKGLAVTGSQAAASRKEAAAWAKKAANTKKE